LRCADHGHAARINERLARQEQERALGVERALEDDVLFRVVFLRRARVINSANRVAVDE
jgi:hypothetical protein